MHAIPYLWAQGVAGPEPASGLALLLQFGMAGAVLVLAFGFLAYLQKRDIRDTAERQGRDQILVGLTTNLRELSGTIERLEAYLESRLKFTDAARSRGQH